MEIKELKEDVYNANIKLVEHDLVTLTWGNVSGINRSEGLVVIKPSGVEYDEMGQNDMVVLDMKGKTVEGEYRPSSDTPTHIELYKAFPSIGGIAHTHSNFATMFAQAQMEIPCFGTTHADHFYGNVPLARVLTELEVEGGYEKHTGTAIIERLEGIDPLSVPGVLLSSHAPFSWGKDAKDAVKHSLIIERIAEMAYGSMQLNENLTSIEKYIMDKHYNRKHGPNAYYGQN